MPNKIGKAKILTSAMLFYYRLSVASRAQGQIALFHIALFHFMLQSCAIILRFYTFVFHNLLIELLSAASQPKYSWLAARIQFS
jgi:hypothetical protein